MSEQQQITVVISGRVQGVGFRANTAEQARALGCTGWVRNNPNGTVECLAQGTREQLEQFIDLLQEGPPSATVQSVDVEWQTASIVYGTFTIAYVR